MEVKTFVSETLQQIYAGVKEAQMTEGGEAINAENAGVEGGNLFSAGTYGTFTRVDFDVAVSAETAGGGKGSIRVFGLWLRESDHVQCAREAAGRSKKPAPRTWLRESRFRMSPPGKTAN